MGFLRRDKPQGAALPHAFGAGPQAQPAGGAPGVSIEELTDVILEGMREAPIEPDMLELLQAGLPTLVQRMLSPEAVIAGQTAARLGYLSRMAEFALFDGQLEADEGLFQTLSDGLDAAAAAGTPDIDALAELAVAIVVAEPLVPSHDDDGPSATLPGLGGLARVQLRDALVTCLKRPYDVPLDDLKRTWKYGYFLRVLDELCEED